MLARVYNSTPTNLIITKTCWFLLQHLLESQSLILCVLHCRFRLPTTFVFVRARASFFPTFHNFTCFLSDDGLPYRFLTILWRAEFLILLKSKWSISFMLFAFCVISKKYLLYSRSWIFSPVCFFCRSFRVFLFTFRSMIYFKLIFVYMWGKVH